jgi:hypothetical protein
VMPRYLKQYCQKKGELYKVSLNYKKIDMKKLISFLAISVFTILIFSFDKTEIEEQPINPVIGDISFMEKFGYQPDKNTDEDLRIKTHLEYVEMLLRRKDVSNLPANLKQPRLQSLNLLHAYWTRGVFPRNYDYVKGRKPCFIDKENRICAVGYLIEKTAGRAIAEQINNNHKYDELLLMNNKAVDKWIAASGLTKQECAMIQPAYGPAPVYSYNHISSSYAISSSLVGGVNLSLNTINAVQMAKGTGNKAIPMIGLVAGAGQIILGAANFSNNTTLNGEATNESKKTLSMVNIGMGTTTMILSAWNLVNQKRSKDKLTTWAVYSNPLKNRKINMGIHLARKL